MDTQATFLRGERNTHPTVKPITLMRWLCRLVTPLGGIVLDPFMGSGSTGLAALVEGMGFLGIEAERDYYELALRRTRAAIKEKSVLRVLADWSSGGPTRSLPGSGFGPAGVARSGIARPRNRK